MHGFYLHCKSLIVWYQHSFLQKCALRLIYFALTIFMLFLFPQNSKILPGNMIYFDTVSNLMHDIWEWLAPSLTRTLYTRSNESRVQHKGCRDKGNYPRKEVKLGSFECSLPRFGAILWNQNSPDWRDISEPILKKKFEYFYLRLFRIGMTMLKSTHSNS